MVSLIKNQILKHLSKFAKNLSPNQINLSTFKGEGELTNLELNEDVLMDLLELPLWLRLTKATCNKLSIKVQWTKLKSVPLCVYLDELIVEMETCEKLRQASTESTLPAYSSGGKYGFPDMVIDGMTVTVNVVEVKFKSEAFFASFQLTRIRLESCNPNWQRSDLRMTRIKNADRGEILIFKELEWQMLRIEASATDQASEFTSPLRLITNQARCRITLKKRLNDCGILASRLILILDDLLWVLTDTQIQAALHFVSSLSSLIKESDELDKRVKAIHKYETITIANHSRMTQQQSRNTNHAQAQFAQLVNKYDIVETSFHLHSSNIDLHFCDEAKPESQDGGGAMQVSLTQLSFDYYPYHLANGDRKHWLRYDEANSSSVAWVEQLMANYKRQLLENIGDVAESNLPTRENGRRSSSQSKMTIASTFLKRLMSSCLLLSLGDFAVYQVSTAATRKKVPEKFFSSDKGRLMLPSSMPAVHVEFVDYYFPGDDDFPVPVPNLHVHWNPVQVTFESDSILWLSTFLLTLQKSNEFVCDPDDAKPVDVRIELVMPRVIFPALNKELIVTEQLDRPQSLQIQISRMTATNSRIGEKCSRDNLKRCLELFRKDSFFVDGSFPSMPKDTKPLDEMFTLHATGKDDLRHLDLPSSQRGKSQSEGRKSFFQRNLLWTENKSVWCVQVEPIWADFCGTDRFKKRPVPFIDAVHCELWVARDVSCSRQLERFFSESCSGHGNANSECEVASNLHVLAEFKSLVNVQMNHFQYLFLMRTVECLADFATKFANSVKCVVKDDGSTSRVCAAAVFPEVDVSFVVPIDLSKTGSDGHYEVDSIGDVSSSTANAVAEDQSFKQSHSSRVETASTLLLTKNSIPSDGRDDVSCRSEHLTSSCSDNTIGRKLKDEDATSLTAPFAANHVQRRKQSLSEDDVDCVNLISVDGFNAVFTKDDKRKISSGNFQVIESSSGEKDSLEKIPDQFGKSFISGKSVVKKGFSSLVASFDSAIHNAKSIAPTSMSSTQSDHMLFNFDGPQVFEDVDTLSICSDFSDSDQFVLLNSDGSFLNENPFISSVEASAVEVGSEVKEDEICEPLPYGSFKRKDYMQVVVLKFGNVHLISEKKDEDSVSKLKIDCIGCDESPSVEWEEFQSSFSLGSRTWNETSMNSSLRPCDIKLRFQQGPSLRHIDMETAERGFLEGIISKASFSLKSSSIGSLTDVIEDEIVQLPMPLSVTIYKSQIHLQHDSKTSDGLSHDPNPTVVDVDDLIISRTLDGVLHIVPKSTGSHFSLRDRNSDLSLTKRLTTTVRQNDGSDVNCCSKSMDFEEKLFNLQEENEQLRMKVIDLESLQWEIAQLRKDLECSESNNKLLKTVQSEVLSLKEEKKCLTATLQLLQNELLVSESKYCKKS